MIAAIGELLIDFIPAGISEEGIPLFAMNAGGAPANVLACLAKLGKRTAFIGMVGADFMGDYLENCLRDCGIDTQGLMRSDKAGTTLAFVHLDNEGNRSFSFRRNPGADQLLTIEYVDKSIINQCDILHFGSVSMTDSPSRETTLDTVREAKALGKIISYDPNYRPLLWKSKDEAIRFMNEGAILADIIKLSDEELPLLTGKDDFKEGANVLLCTGCSIVLVTCGRKGAYFFTKNHSGFVPAYEVKTVDTTGAGDCFLGAMLFRLRGISLNDICRLPKEELMDIIDFACAAGSLSTTKKGAISSLPSLKDIEVLQSMKGMS